jgi:hypothetical protein
MRSAEREDVVPERRREHFHVHPWSAQIIRRNRTGDAQSGIYQMRGEPRERKDQGIGKLIRILFIHIGLQYQHSVSDVSFEEHDTSVSRCIASCHSSLVQT